MTKSFYDVIEYINKYNREINAKTDEILHLLQKDVVFTGIDIIDDGRFIEENLINKIKSKEPEFTKLWLEIRVLVKDVTFIQGCLAKLLYLLCDGFIEPSDSDNAWTLAIQFHTKFHKGTRTIELLERCNFLSFSTLFFWYSKGRSQFFSIMQQDIAHKDYIVNH